MIIEIPDRVDIPQRGAGTKSVHLFDQQAKWAIRAALAAKRPLLVRGEPGVGKSQLAHAAAVALKRPLLTHVVNARTEALDLLYSFDAVQRLARAQLCVAMKDKNFEATLAQEKFIHPGPLWWAFHWGEAAKQAAVVKAPVPEPPPKWQSGNGCVLLIDEIDKAESDVPNGLLEALGAHCFPVLGRSEPITMLGQPPLVVITTNEDRALPNAFVRRCLVLHIELPNNNDVELRKLLVARGKAHQPNMADELLEHAAERLIHERNVQKNVRPRPGQAEYLDLIRALAEIMEEPAKIDPKSLFNEIAGFVLKKNAGAPS